jgi:hypothetical protein
LSLATSFASCFSIADAIILDINLAMKDFGWISRFCCILDPKALGENQNSSATSIEISS